MLYANGNSASYNNYPSSWSTTGVQGFIVARGIFILAILPVLLLLIGALAEAFVFIRSILKHDITGVRDTSYGIFILTFIGYISFVTLYALFYQTFQVIKSIFIFPALLTFPVLFLRTAKPLYAFLSKRNKWSVHILNADIITLMILYVMDILILINRIRLYH